MKIFINQDSKKFVSSQKFNAVVNRFDFKRGDTAKIELGYVQDNELVQLAGAYTIVFGIKEAGKYDGDYVVYEAGFVYNATTGFYEGEPNFNTIELNDLLNADDGDDTNDIPYIDCLFEITATDDNGISSSATSTARVFHDVNKGNEGIPTGANPSYSVVGHTHTALDNLAVTNDFTVDTDTLHVDSTSNRVGVGTNSPAASLHVLGQQLRIDDPNSGVYLYTGVTELGYIQALTGNLMRVVQSQPLPLAFYTSNTEAMRLDAGGNLGIGTTSPSTTLEVNGTQSFTSNSGTWDGATFAGAQSFTSATLTAPNLVSTDPDSLVKRSDLSSYEITNTSGTVDLTYQNHYVDPTTGDVTLTLPDSQLTTSDGALVTIKRVENGGNIVKIETAGGDSINGYSTDVILSNQNEYITLQALPVIGWQTLNKHTTAYASIALTTPTTFAATTAFTKLTTWDLDLFSTNQKFEANSSGSTLDVLHHTGAPFDAYAINATVSIEGLKDQYINAQLYDGAGNPLSPFVAVNGLGAGKPITITLIAEVVMPAVGTIEVRLLSESAQTLTISAASFLGNRIND